MNKIYKLVYNGVVVYVGKTKQTLKRRKLCGYKENPSVQAIYKQCDMVLIEETSDVSREDFWVNHYKDTVFNAKRGDTGLSEKEWHKEYYESNKEHQNEKMKEWYQSNKEYKKQYRESNKEHYIQYQREYRLKNKLQNGTTD